MSEIVICESCGQPMQEANRVTGKDGKLIAVRYVCYCGGFLKHKNWHAGQAGTER